LHYSDLMQILDSKAEIRLKKRYILFRISEKIACQINWLMSAFSDLFLFSYGISIFLKSELFE